MNIYLIIRMRLRDQKKYSKLTDKPKTYKNKIDKEIDKLIKQKKKIR